MATKKFADLLPPLSTEEFQALKADIKQRGVLVPVFVDEDGNVLDGRHRLRIDPKAPRTVITGLTDAEKEAFVFRSNNARRNLSQAQKKELLKRMKETAFRLREEDGKRWTQKRVADALGVAQNTISVWFAKPNRRNINVDNSSTPPDDNEPPSEPDLPLPPRPDARVKIPATEFGIIYQRHQDGETQEQIAADYGVTQRQISNVVAKVAKDKEREERHAAAAASVDTSALGVHHGDFRTVGDVVPDESIDLIFTDPPYAANAIGLYEDLAAFAARVLKPHGWCLAYSGHEHLPAVYQQMCQSLQYGWTFAIRHNGGDLQFRKFKLNNRWKPIVGFYKAPLDAWWKYFPDLADCGDRDKTLHEWQQSLSEAEHFIAALTPPGGSVCDPFCGSGTSLLAAKGLGLHWVGFDTDEKHVHTAIARLME